MPMLFLPATACSPEIDFQPAAHRLSLSGESYPEHAAGFYAPLLDALREYLAGPSDAAFQVEMSLRYFNSSSTKVLFTLMGLLDNAAREGRDVTVLWHHDAEDDTLQEFGEELSDDFPDLAITCLAHHADS